jgi:hypothetical protein
MESNEINEPLARALQIRSRGYKSEEQKKLIEYLFPQLKETEGGRIVRELMDGIAILSDNGCISKEERKKLVDWVAEAHKVLSCVCDIDEDVAESLELGIDRALHIAMDAKGILKGYQSDDGVYECDSAIEAAQHVLNLLKNRKWSLLSLDGLTREEKDKLNRIYTLIPECVDTNPRLLGDKEADELQSFMRSMVNPKSPKNLGDMITYKKMYDHLNARVKELDNDKYINPDARAARVSEITVLLRNLDDLVENKK